MDYRSNVLQYYKVTGYHVVPAIFFGVICEKISNYLQLKYTIPPLVAVCLQLVLAIFFLYMIEIYICPSCGIEWQAITPGLFFVSIFFGLQTSLYSNIYSTAKQVGLYA